MGIRGLNTFIKKTCPECITVNQIEKYEGKIFAIDVSIFLYKFRYVSNINKLQNWHITGFINRILYYFNNNITPVFVFDGVPPPEKILTLQKRKNTKEKIIGKIELLKDYQNTNKDVSEAEKNEIEKEIEKLSTQVIHVTKKHVNDIKRLFDILNLKYFVAPDEAEKYCTFLYKHGIVDYIVSDDTDVLTFGGEKILRTSIKNNIIEYDYKILLDKLKYDHKKFVDFCILAGCDYLFFVNNLAINTVFTLFKKYDCIEDIIKLNKYNFSDNYNFTDVRKIFLEFHYEIENDLKIDRKINFNKNEFKEFLEENKINNSEKLLTKFNKFLN